MIRTVHPSLSVIRDKVEAGERLSPHDGLLLFRPETHLNDLGELAKADPKLAGLKACSRALRAKMERLKNY